MQEFHVPHQSAWEEAAEQERVQRLGPALAHQAAAIQLSPRLAAVCLMHHLVPVALISNAPGEDSREADEDSRDAGTVSYTQRLLFTQRKVIVHFMNTCITYALYGFIHSIRISSLPKAYGLRKKAQHIV